MNERKRSILIVESDSMVMTFYHYVLSDTYRLFITDNMLAVKKIIETKKIDLVILDLSLGRWVDDLLLIRFIRQENANLMTPILGVALNPFQVDRMNVLDAECNEYIVQPFDVGILLQTVAKLTCTSNLDQTTDKILEIECENIPVALDIITH